MLRIFCLLVVISPYAVATSGWAAQSRLSTAYNAQVQAAEAKQLLLIKITWITITLFCIC